MTPGGGGGHWQAVRTIATWEFLRFFKWKELLVTIGIVIAISVLANPVISLLAGSGGGTIDLRVDLREAPPGADVTRALSMIVQTPEPVHPRFTFTDLQAPDAEARVRAGELDGVLRVGADGGLRIVAQDDPGWRADLSELLTSVVVPLRLQAEGLAPEAAQGALAPPEVAVVAVGQDAYRGSGLIAIMTGILVGSVFTGAGVLFTAITGEKSQRVTEAIVSAVSPQAWIDGKILGTSLFVLAYLITYAVGFAGAFLIYGAMDGRMPPLPSLVTEPWLALLTIVFAALGFGLWFTVFAAIAATVNDPTTSSRGGFIMVPGLALASGFLVSPGTADALLFRILSWLPFTSPTVLPVRAMLGSAAAWEIALSLGLLVGTLLAARRAAGAVFALGIHMTGKEPSLREMARWVRRGA